jgi:hypothetical protein
MCSVDRPDLVVGLNSQVVVARFPRDRHKFQFPKSYVKHPGDVIPVERGTERRWVHDRVVINRYAEHLGFGGR